MKTHQVEACGSQWCYGWDTLDEAWPDEARQLIEACVASENDDNLTIYVNLGARLFAKRIKNA